MNGEELLLHFRMTAPTRRVLSTYVRLWSVANLLRTHVGYSNGTALVGSTLDQQYVFLPLLVLAAGIAPSDCSGMLTVIALCSRAVTNFAKGSFMSNSQVWATQMDLALLFSISRRVWLRCSRRSDSWMLPFSAEDEQTIVAGCARTIRCQFSIFYVASGFWKLNTSFSNSSYSCASLFAAQLLEHLPDAWLFPAATAGASGNQLLTLAVPAFARVVAMAAPFFTLLIEIALPCLQALNPEALGGRAAFLAVTTTLAFHIIIGLTPPPSNVASFGVTTCTRLFFWMPDAVAAAFDDGVQMFQTPAPRLFGTATLGACMALASAATLACVSSLHLAAVSTVQGSGVDWHLAWLAALCVIFGRAMMIHTRLDRQRLAEVGDKGQSSSLTPNSSHSLHPVAHSWLIGLAAVYAFVLPAAGLQEKAGCLMFSQLRMHGGSNHFLLPTGLLQSLLLDAPPSNAFSGGVVRIEATNLSWVGSAFSQHLGARTQRVLREVAGVRAEYIWAEKATTLPRANPPPRFMRHTVSNLGLRQLIATAAAQRDAFWLLYTRLEGAVGDEKWRTESDGLRYVVRSAGDGVVSCSRDGGNLFSKIVRLAQLDTEACDEHETALVLAPIDSVTSALVYWLVPQPNPIVEETAMREEMHCVRWG